ncbi:MAG: energy transducer TonB [Chitinophagales bacterium]
MVSINPTGVFDTVDYSAVFIGGLHEMYNFIVNEIRYPAIARDNGIEGTVYTKFIIEANGTISNSEIVRGIGGGCDEECLRIIKLMSGNWIPANDNGVNISMFFTLPFKFSLE